MLSEKEAVASLLRAYPSVNPQKVITLDGLYLIFAPTDDPLEGDMDPYYSVDRETGFARDYSIYREGRAAEIVQMFIDAPLHERR